MVLVKFCVCVILALSVVVHIPDVKTGPGVIVAVDSGIVCVRDMVLIGFCCVVVIVSKVVVIVSVVVAVVGGPGEIVVVPVMVSVLVGITLMVFVTR